MNVQFGNCPWSYSSGYTVEGKFKTACQEALKKQPVKLASGQLSGVESRLSAIESSLARIEGRFNTLT